MEKHGSNCIISENIEHGGYEMGKEKDKSIETPELLIKGNIMCWEGTMIQLSNISCISTAPLEALEFPKLSILCILGGLIVGNQSAVLGFAFLAVGAAWIYYWYYTNEKRKSDTILNVVMNSGNNLRFLVKDKKFLEKILRILERIIIEGGVGEKNISIDIHECEITGNASILNDCDFL